MFVSVYTLIKDCRVCDLSRSLIESKKSSSFVFIPSLISYKRLKRRIIIVVDFLLGASGEKVGFTRG